MSSSLVAMKKAARSFIHKEKLTETRIVDPNILMEGLDMGQHRDPVHPPAEFYSKLAAKLTALLEGEAVEAHGGPSDSRPEPDPKRIRLVSSCGGSRGRPFQRGGRGSGRGTPVAAPGAADIEDGFNGTVGTGKVSGVGQQSVGRHPNIK